MVCLITHIENSVIFFLLLLKNIPFFWFGWKPNFVYLKPKKISNKKWMQKKSFIYRLWNWMLKTFIFISGKKNEFQLYLLIVKIIQTKLYMEIDDDQWKCPLLLLSKKKNPLSLSNNCFLFYSLWSLIVTRRCQIQKNQCWQMQHIRKQQQNLEKFSKKMHNIFPI